MPLHNSNRLDAEKDKAKLTCGTAADCALLAQPSQVHKRRHQPHPASPEHQDDAVGVLQASPSGSLCTAQALQILNLDDIRSERAAAQTLDKKS